MRRDISSISGLPPRTVSISSSSLSRVSVAPFVPIETVWPEAHSSARPSKDFESLLASPLMKVSSNFCWTDFALSATTAASMSCTLLRVRAM